MLKRLEEPCEMDVKKREGGGAVKKESWRKWAKIKGGNGRRAKTTKERRRKESEERMVQPNINGQSESKESENKMVREA